MLITKAITEKEVNKKLSQFKAEERESSILFDHVDGQVYIETTKPDVARRLLAISSHPEVRIDDRVESFRIIVPEKYVRTPELILMAKLRKS